MEKVRLSGCFDCTMEVLSDSKHEVIVQEAKEVVAKLLPFLLDGAEYNDCTITGVNITSRDIEELL
jgi:hypothetical protein